MCHIARIVELALIRFRFVRVGRGFGVVALLHFFEFFLELLRFFLQFVDDFEQLGDLFGDQRLLFAQSFERALGPALERVARLGTP